MKPIKSIIDPVVVNERLFGTCPKTHKLRRTTRIVEVREKDEKVIVETKNTIYECKFTGFTLEETFRQMNNMDL